MIIMNMKKIIIMKTTMMKINFLIISLILCSSCATSIKIVDQNMNNLTPPLTLVSRSSPNSYGIRTYKVRDANGFTFTSQDNSLESLKPGSTFVPSARPSFSTIDKVLMKLKPPVIVIGKAGKDGQVLKVIDKKKKIITIEDITLSSYQIGDTIK